MIIIIAGVVILIVMGYFVSKSRSGGTSKTIPIEVNVSKEEFVEVHDKIDSIIKQIEENKIIHNYNNDDLQSLIHGVIENNKDLENIQDIYENVIEQIKKNNTNLSTTKDDENESPSDTSLQDEAKHQDEPKKNYLSKLLHIFSSIM